MLMCPECGFLVYMDRPRRRCKSQGLKIYRSTSTEMLRILVTTGTPEVRGKAADELNRRGEA